MAESLAIAFIVLFAFQGVGTVTYLFMISRLFSRLKASHTPVWESLGSPSLILNNSLQNNRLVLGWLWRKEYSELRDPTTVDLAQTVRTFLVTLLANFALLLVLFFVSNALP